MRRMSMYRLRRRRAYRMNRPRYGLAHERVMRSRTSAHGCDYRQHSKASLTVDVSPPQTFGRPLPTLQERDCPRAGNGQHLFMVRRLLVSKKSVPNAT